jgi:thymidylate kinase
MIILEGTDAVGKTSVINNLDEYNLLDRDKNISKLFMFDISLVERVNKLVDYLKRNNIHVIFLVNNDKEELERRVNLRKVHDEFDKYTYLYNLMYLETYLYMEQNNLLNNKLYMVDCTGLNIEEETCKVKKLIDKIRR